mgnify:CR=1 FL=1
MKKRTALKIANAPADKFGVAKYKRNRIVMAIRIVMRHDLPWEHLGLQNLLYLGFGISQVIPRRGSNPKPFPFVLCQPVAATNSKPA